MASNRRPGIQIAWKTVTYRSVFMMILFALLLVGAGARLAFPQFSENTVKAASNVFTRLLERVAAPTNLGNNKNTSQQAHITALDGTVKIRKSGSETWIKADYSVPLEKGDVIQTGSEGMAKVAFNDGTSYTVKQDSLIVIAENSANDRQQTNVAVNVTTGTVDLSTGTYVQGSTSQVIVDGATASLAPESAARVRKDPKSADDELLITKGQGTVERGGQTVELADWEKATFKAGSGPIEKTKEIGPPTPISPANMMPIFSPSDDSKPVEFSWTPMANAKGYRLQISRNPYFSSLILDRKVTSSAVMISGLTEGPYYWMVESYDASGKESAESEKNRFTVIAKATDSGQIRLELDPLIQHGRVIELSGKTEVNARVMVNGHEVPVIGQDGSFHYFMPPLPNGESTITITAQNSHGGVNTQQEKVVIQ